MAIVVLSCDKYSDLWNDFFNIKDMFWPDCNFKWYLATDSKPYQRDGVEVIHFGNIREWTKCVRTALQQIDAPYICPFLEDAFISKKIDNKLINDLVDYSEKNHVSFLCLERKSVLPLKDREHVDPYISIIPKHLRFGVDTSGAIWEKDFFMKKLSQWDCSAWDFEVNMAKEADSEEGMDGYLLVDDRKPLNISEIEVVRLGKFRPDAIKMFHKLGYDIDTSQRPVMNFREYSMEKIKCWGSRIKYGRKTIKKIAKIFGFTFFTDN